MAPCEAYAFRPKISEGKGEKILAKQREMHAVDSEVSKLRLASIDSQGNVSAREFISAFANSDSYVNSLIFFTEPESIRGTIFLAHYTVERTNPNAPKAWVYLPELNAVRELEENMPGQNRFFGSEFTWEDIILESMTPQKSKWIRSTRFQNRPADLIELTPTRGPKYLRGRRELYIDSKTFHTLRVDVFSRSSDLTKTMTAYDYGSMDIDGISKRPHRLVAQNISSLETSVLTLIKARQNIEIASEIFHKNALPELSKSTEPFWTLIEAQNENEP
ncbi:MAG: outer membrane lipoprotein-sorting protein [Verrucomicrobiota bacterium]